MFRITIPDSYIDRIFTAANMAYAIRSVPVRIRIADDSPRSPSAQMDVVVRCVDSARPDWLQVRKWNRQLHESTGNSFWVIPESIHII